MPALHRPKQRSAHSAATAQTVSVGKVDDLSKDWPALVDALVSLASRRDACLLYTSDAADE